MKNTVQKDLVYSCLKELCCHPTCDEIYREVIKKAPSVTKATVYRNLEGLEQEGKVLKIETEEHEAHFDHNAYKHFHFQCRSCKRVFDIDLKSDPEAEKLVKKGQDFFVEGYSLLYIGLCPSCKEKKARDK